MTKMTKQQTEYALQRLHDANKKRRDAIKAAHTNPAIVLSWDDKWALVKSGKVAPREKTPERAPIDWRTLYDFSAYEFEERTDAAGTRKLETLAAEYVRARDEIMLGDSEAALELVRSFTSQT